MNVSSASRQMRIGFTLIELLVVITIIVILLALLVPALDRAIYQAELAQCGGGLRALGSAAITYAFDNRRRWPDRPGVRDDADTPIYAWRPNTINDSITYDDRPLFATFLSLNAHLTCPFSDPIDIERSQDSTIIEANYNIWFGFQYDGLAGMQRVGDRVTWVEESESPPRRYRFNVLADDYEMYFPQGNYIDATHPDKDGVLSTIHLQDEGVGLVWTMSRWQTSTQFRRGPMDRNFAYDDGSVQRLEDLEVDHETGAMDERLVPLPPFAQSGTTTDHKNSLPR